MVLSSPLLLRFVGILLLGSLVNTWAGTVQGGLLDELRRVPVTTLVDESRAQGDATRGAVTFYQRHLTCTQCHTADDTGSQLGPDLTQLGKEVTDEQLVEALLQPSKSIRRGYETLQVTTREGKVIHGLLVNRTAESLELRDAGNGFMTTIVPVAAMEAEDISRLSVMPEGLPNLLGSRQQFFDLVKYLIEIRDGGAARAKQLQPPPSIISTQPLPEYESHLDHAGLIRAWNDESRQRGEAIYLRTCANCHGTHDQVGSLPTSLRFGSGAFKNGRDPYSMYQTITRGFGMMVPQTWMVPSQKYDVIHYIRETYLRPHNPSQFVAVDDAYLSRLPIGDTQGPEAVELTPWAQTDYGPNLVMTLEAGDDGTNIAQKANAIRLDAGPGGIAQGRHWLSFDYDTLRVSAIWSDDEFCNWQGINFDGRHNSHPRIEGRVLVSNPTGPGWAKPGTQDYHDDQRIVGRDGRHYGPLPRTWAQYRGMYYHGNDTIVHYTVGSTRVWERPSVQRPTSVPTAEPTEDDATIYVRTLKLSARATSLDLQVAQHTGADLQGSADRHAEIRFGVADPRRDDDAYGLRARLIGAESVPLAWHAESGNLRLSIPAGDEPLEFSIALMTEQAAREQAALKNSALDDAANPNVATNDLAASNVSAASAAMPDLLPLPPLDLSALQAGGPSRWPHRLPSDAVLGDDSGAFAVDTLTPPADNPWFCRMRLTGLDFVDGDTMAVCDWDGNVWRVTGLSQLDQRQTNQAGQRVTLTWQRIASGLFQPLGLKYHLGKIHVTCRDQLCVLHDFNGDHETDYYECLNNDHQVTEHFHEFAMGLQVDAAGNFYYAKSARHALTAIVPHHGTLLRVSPDGKTTAIVAQGFRAANGVCLNPDGTFIVTDQEGHWNPKNRINYVQPGHFYGNMFAYHDVTDDSDEAMEQPLCWITNDFDRSPAELIWVDSPRWGALNRHLLNLSYGYGMVYVVPHEIVDGQPQGGMCALPIDRLPTGVMRGRFRAADQQLYLCGMFAWAGNQTEPGGLFRLRATGKPMDLPTELRATSDGVEITLGTELDRDAAEHIERYGVSVWSLKRSKDYGSQHYNERSLTVTKASLSSDRRTVRLTIPDLKPTWGMEINYELQSADGRRFSGKIHNTIHKMKH